RRPGRGRPRGPAGARSARRSSPTPGPAPRRACAPSARSTASPWPTRTRRRDRRGSRASGMCIAPRARPGGRRRATGRRWHGRTARPSGGWPHLSGGESPAAGHGPATWARRPRGVSLAGVIPSRPQEPLMTAIDARLELQRLQAERLDAADAGLGENAIYMADLETDIEASRVAYVALAVAEIATLRAELSGPQVG